jgi:hypothetical protein
MCWYTFGPLVCFTALHILGFWYIFPRFGIMSKEKFGIADYVCIPETSLIPVAETGWELKQRFTSRAELLPLGRGEHFSQHRSLHTQSTVKGRTKSLPPTSPHGYSHP